MARSRFAAVVPRVKFISPERQRRFSKTLEALNAHAEGDNSSRRSYVMTLYVLTSVFFLIVLIFVCITAMVLWGKWNDARTAQTCLNNGGQYVATAVPGDTSVYYVCKPK